MHNKNNKNMYIKASKIKIFDKIILKDMKIKRVSAKQYEKDNIVLYFKDGSFNNFDLKEEIFVIS
ncbi:MAG: hypothetical protein WAW57_15365 [Lutibacter sp.]